jgi:5-methylcytosine-specific restriction endonuclease McrA
MLRLKRLGYSYGKIAQLYGISRQRVHQITSGYGKNLKSLHEGNGQYWKVHNMVLERDSYICQRCGSLENPVIHHIDGDDTNNKIPNLVTLCNKCHLTLHRQTEDIIKIHHQHTPVKIFEKVEQVE